jgi:hypothetical protein
MAVTNTTMICGDTGTGKSALLATAAEWGWKNHRKVSLLYSSDGGGFPTKLDALIRAGIIRVWKIRTRGEAFETCSRACQGQWPTEFLDPLTGETAPGVPLAAPIKSTYTLICCYCDKPVAKRSSKRAFQNAIKCPECQKQVNLQTGSIQDVSERPPFFKDVGLVMYDGLTSMQDWIMEDMADKTGRGELRGEGSALGGKVVSGDMVFGGSNRSHYGFAQVRAAQWIQDATNIPGLVLGPFFTARQQRATDSNTNLRIYGPAIAGQAKTADVPAWVANCLGSMIHIDDKKRKEFRLYLTEYREEDGIPHLCKTRAYPGTMPDYLSDGPIDSETGLPVEGKPFGLFNLGHFLDLMEAATKKTLEETAESCPDAPGLGYLKDLAGGKTGEKEEKNKAAEKKPTTNTKVAAARPVINRPTLTRPPVVRRQPTK